MERLNNFRLLVGLGALGAASATALAHNHITVDTAAGTPQDKIVIRAGYLAADAGYSISDGRLMFDGQIAVYDVPDRLSQAGPLDGWAAGDEILLTSDYFAGTGRLDGGNFRYEIAQVTAVSGAGDAAAAVWGDFSDTTGALVAAAESTAGTRSGRSFAVGVGGHDHDQGFALHGAWVIDVALVAWDGNGVYADSDPVTVRFDTGACPADFDRTNGVNVGDIFAFLRAWFARDAKADFDGSGGVGVGDIFAFLRGWFAGCS